MRKTTVLIILVFSVFQSFAQESWIVPCDSLVYRETEELFLGQGWVPPLEEQPAIADDLRNNLGKLMSLQDQALVSQKAFDLYHSLKLAFQNISPILELGLSGYFNDETDRLHYITTYNQGPAPTPTPLPVPDKDLTDFSFFYDINKIPSIMKLGFTAQYANFSIMFQPELRAANSYLLANYTFMNLPTNPVNIDNNFPYRGIFTYYSMPLEVRFGRDKLQLGPSRNSPLLITKYMPYFDFAKVRFFCDWISLSWYLIRLNPTITDAESQYLDNMYDGLIPNPEDNAQANGKTYNERAKNLIISKLVMTPVPWLILDITQTNLIGGRDPELSDLNPLIVFHNLFSEGTYSVPLDLSATIVPYKGIRLYFDYLFYDAAVGDEANPAENPGAAAYQAGFTVLSEPFFTLGPGRFRLDGEATLVDPWVYGKYYDLRKFTSRIIYLESFVGRMWVDYPLGFYLGPDCLDINLYLSYGEPGKWETILSWNRNGMGSIDLYGWGLDNDYSHTGEPGYPLSGAPTSSDTVPVQWTDTVQLRGYWVPFAGLELSAWYRIKYVQNRFHIPGSNNLYNCFGLGAVLKIF